MKKLLDLRQGAEEKRVIIENVKDDADFSSARFWTLVFAIVIASVGLNINSVPVVIGAMLISPLMGPIVSMGLALSIYDWGLLRRSFRNMLILTGISIGISAIYFALTPITNAQSELLSRIQPTIFDVLIAVFGGLAGFIGVSRAKHSNVIPGVAIATALMPPLCTVGYGIGTLQPKFIFGAFYLFLINSIFICLASLLVARYLKLPKREYPDAAKKKRVNRIVTAIILVITLPAAYTAYTFVQQNNFYQHADEYIQRVFEDRGYVVIYENIDYAQTDRVIELAFLSESFSEEQIAEFNERLLDFNLHHTTLVIRQNGFALTQAEWESVVSEIQGESGKVEMLEKRLVTERLSYESPSRLLEEAKAMSTKVENIAISNLEYGLLEAEGLDEKRVVFIYTKTEDAPLTTDEADMLTRWIHSRLQDTTIQIYFSPEPSQIIVPEPVVNTSN